MAANMFMSQREQWYLTQVRQVGLRLGDSPELSQLCQAAYEDYRQGLLSASAYNTIPALCVDLAYPH